MTDKDLAKELLNWLDAVRRLCASSDGEMLAAIMTRLKEIAGPDRRCSTCAHFAIDGRCTVPAPEWAERPFSVAGWSGTNCATWKEKR